VVDLFARIRADAQPIGDEPDAVRPDEVAAASEGVDGIWGAVHDDDHPEHDAQTDVTAEASEDTAADATGETDDVTASTPFEQRDEDLTPLIVGSAKKLKRVLADEQNGVLDALRRHHPVRDLDDLLPPVGEHAARYGDAISDDLLLAAQAGAASVASGRVATLSKTAGTAAISAATGGLDQWLVAPLRERLQRCVFEGDGDNDVIAKKVRAAYREWKTKRIDEMLDDVLMSAHGRGVLAAFRAGTQARWGIDQRHSACADCDDNALAGAVASGDEFPTGDTFAPAHPGCRCILLPVGR